MWDIPYFMTNDDWYKWDGEKFVLTDDAPKEAKESYKAFYKDINTHPDNTGRRRKAGRKNEYEY